MEPLAIMTDTNSGVTPDEARRANIELLAMPVLVDGREFREYQNITQEQFYKLQQEGAQISSSQPAPAELLGLWDQLLDQYDRVIYIPMSSGLSGSCATAIALAQEYGGRVSVVDAHRISVPLKQAVLEAAMMRDAGIDADRVIRRLMEKSMQFRVYISVEDLQYLRKSGRITPAVAAVGSVLSIKPVMQIMEGKLDMYRKVRGMKQACKTMLDALQYDLEHDFAGKDVIVGAAYSGDSAVGSAWAETVHQRFSKYPFQCDALPLSIGCHVGAGALGVGLVENYD